MKLVHILKDPIAIGAMQDVVTKFLVHLHIVRAPLQQRRQVGRSESVPRLRPFLEVVRRGRDARHVHEVRTRFDAQYVFGDLARFSGSVVDPRHRSALQSRLPPRFRFVIFRHVDLDALARQQSALLGQSQQRHQHRRFSHVGDTDRQRDVVPPLHHIVQQSIVQHVEVMQRIIRLLLVPRIHEDALGIGPHPIRPPFDPFARRGIDEVGVRVAYQVRAMPREPREGGMVTRSRDARVAYLEEDVGVEAPGVDFGEAVVFVFGRVEVLDSYWRGGGGGREPGAEVGRDEMVVANGVGPGGLVLERS